MGHVDAVMGRVHRAQLFVVTSGRARWNALWERLGATPPEEAFSELEACYSSPGRHYHTLAHLDAVLAAFDRLRHLAPDPDVAELALWLHDVVWEPMRDDCEQRSVEWAMERLPAVPGLAPLPGLILETRHLAAPSVDPNAAVVRDADLAILASDEATFDAYERAVRAEYAMIQEEDFRRGRARILADFASRRPLFFTPVMQAREPQARANLARSLSALGG
jgi:predicted metal-dependent HD superfamily phosphohydrolase